MSSKPTLVSVKGPTVAVAEKEPVRMALSVASTATSTAKSSPAPPKRRTYAYVSKRGAMRATHTSHSPALDSRTPPHQKSYDSVLPATTACMAESTAIATALSKLEPATPSSHGSSVNSSEASSWHTVPSYESAHAHTKLATPLTHVPPF